MTPIEVDKTALVLVKFALNSHIKLKKKDFHKNVNQLSFCIRKKLVSNRMFVYKLCLSVH